MSVPLDLMEYANNGAAQAAYVSSDTGPLQPASWDLLDEDCAAIDDWNDDDKGAGVSEVSPAGQFRFDTNLGAAGNDYASRIRNIGSTPNTFTLELKVYHDNIGTNASNDYFRILVWQADELLLLRFCSDGQFINDTDVVETEVGTDLVKEAGSAEWQIWRFLVTYGAVGDGVCDVYLKDSTHDWVKVGTAIPCSYEAGGNDGEVKITQLGYATNNMVTHVDYIKIATGLTSPIPILQCYSESSIKIQGDYSLKVVAVQTDSLNETLIRTVNPTINLSDMSTLKYHLYSSRTGQNIRLAIHDSGGAWVNMPITNITDVDTWQEQTCNIGAINNTDKDAIDRIRITIINADAANTFYIDNYYGVGVYAKNFTDDVMTLSEPIFFKGIGKLPAEIATLSEPFFLRGMGKNLTETATLSEIFGRSLSLVRWTETVTLTEVAQKAIAFIILEITTLSEVLQKAMGQNPVETATLSEVFSRASVIKRWVETATLTDSISKGPAKAFVDDVYTLSEAINKWHLPAAKTTVWTEISEESGMWTKEEAGIAWNQL